MRIILIDTLLISKDNQRIFAGGLLMHLTTLTKKQRHVLDSFERESRPLTAHQAWMAAGIESMGQATVYRAIAKLEQLGLLTPVEIHGAPLMWETKSLGHHHHFFCTSCSGVYELQGCPGNLRSILPNGFSMADHTITIYGNCASCQTNCESRQ